MNWCAKLATVSAALALLGGASCSQTSPPSTIRDANKMGSVVVGRSTRTEVFVALGRPDRMERSLLGETWIYEAKGDDLGGQTFINGVAAASGVVGAFVPYVGLAGSSLRLADAAAGAARRKPDMVSVAVSFGDNGIVRDCLYSSTALPAGVSGAAEGSAKIAACRKPSPTPAAVSQER